MSTDSISEFQSNLKFYENLPSFSQFSEITNNRHYEEIPDDWWVFVADIRGSTRAIEEGRYRDVNMIGAACIASVLNAVKSFEVPYVFGGDGATIVCPSYIKQNVIEALSAVQRRSFEKLVLELRVGCVSVKAIRSMGLSLKVAKHQIAENVTLAMFTGGGLSKAEELVKANSEFAEIFNPTNQTEEPELQGLSCRWSPFKSTHGHILSIITKARQLTYEGKNPYLEIIESIESILQNSLEHHNPVAVHKLNKFATSAAGLKTEWSMSTNVKDKWKQLFGVYARALTSKLVIGFNIWFGPFIAKVYKAQTVKRTDHKKFDDTLRMILDCSETHKVDIESYLQRIHVEGKIDYGIHRSDTALMTCYVPGATDGTHIHFIDGNDGGYTLAAKEMKTRIINSLRA